MKSSVFCVAAVAGEVDWDTLSTHLLGEVKVPLGDQESSTWTYS